MQQEFRPQWAKHVVGRFNKLTMNEDGVPEPQYVKLHCETCGEQTQVHCASGAYKQHVLMFAKVHIHKDPFGVAARAEMDKMIPGRRR